jgi:hypothetical protein
MKKFVNRKRAVLASAFFAISSFALAPGVIHHQHQVAAAWAHTQPQLQEPSTKLPLPDFRMTLPEPDYTVPALPLQAPEITGAGEPDLEIVADSRHAIAGIHPQWFDQIGRGTSSAGSSRQPAATGSGAVATNATPRQTFASPQERDPDAAPTDDTPNTEETAPEQTELASNDVPDAKDLPGADELHNPVNPTEPNETKPGSSNAVAVPEPSAFALLVAGLIGLILTRRRQR